MKTKISKSKFVAACKVIRPLMDKDLLSDFSLLRIDAAGDNVSLTGGNSNIQVEIRMAGSTDAPGMEIVNGAQVERFVGTMPEGVVSFDTKGANLHVTSGEGIKFKMKTGDAAKFRTMPGPGDDAVAALTIPAQTFREMFRKVRYASGADLNRAVLIGVCCEWAGGTLSLVATDGRRLSHIETACDLSEGGEFQVVLPKRAVATLYGLLDCDGDVDIRIGANAMRVTGPEWCVTSSYVDGKYPSWRNIIPETVAHEAKIDRVEFLEALRRAAAASSGSDLPVVEISLANGALSIAATGQDASAKMDIATCEIADGATLVRKFNPVLLSEALESVDEDSFSWFFNDGGEIAVLRSSLPWVAVVMPVRQN